MDSRDYTYGAQVRYPNDRVNLSYSWQDIGENFDPKLGYVRRRGVAVNSVTAQYRPRPQSNRYIRQVTFGFGFNDYYNKSRHETESRNYSYNPFGLLLHGGERFSYTINQNYERLFQPFHIHEGIAIPVGQYSFVRHVLATSGPTNKVLSYSVSYDRGGFYSGSSDETGVELDLEEEREPDNQFRASANIGFACSRAVSTLRWHCTGSTIISLQTSRSRTSFNTIPTRRT